MNLSLSSGLRWFQALLLVSQVAGATVAAAGRGQDSLSRDLNQVEAAKILNLQTNLRRVLIRSLVDVRNKITQFEGFHSVVGEIIQGLRRREVDPFDSFRDGEDAGSAVQLEKILRNLQGERGCKAGDLSLRRKIDDAAPSLAVAGPTREQLQIIKKARRAFVETVLIRIGEGSLKLNEEFLRDILYNFRFREYSGDLEMFTENVIQMLEGRPLDFSGFHAASAKEPDEILSAVLRYVSVNSRSAAELRYQIDRLLSALSGMGSVVRLSEATEEDEDWRLLELMLADDYPPDVVRGKKALSRLLRGGGRRVRDLEGRPPGERLLMLVSGLTSVSREAKVAYPHLKLRLLSSEGKFFRPRVASDVAFLLDSFLTALPKVSPTFIQQVNRVFFSSDWEEALKNFDFSRYSRPRTLFLDMVQRLLENSAKLPLCGKIVLGHFLRINRQNGQDVSSSAIVHSDDGLFFGKTENPYVGVVSDVEYSTPGAIDTPLFIIPSSTSNQSAGEKFVGSSSTFFIPTSQSTKTTLSPTTATFSPPSSITTISGPVIFTETSEFFTIQTSPTATSERLLVTDLSTASDYSEPLPPTSTTFIDLELNSTSPSPLGESEGGREEMLWSSDDATFFVSDSADQNMSSTSYPVTSTEILSSSDHISPDGL